MGRKLRKVQVAPDLWMEEKACEDYACRVCGKKMISVNFVNGIAIQVFAVHGVQCTLYPGNGGQRTRVVTCETCVHYDEHLGCRSSDMPNPAMEQLRTNAAAL